MIITREPHILEKEDKEIDTVEDASYGPNSEEAADDEEVDG